MTESIQYRPLTYDECERIREIDASQYIGRAWREVDGNLQLVEIDYLDSDFPEGFDNHLRRLRKTVRDEGIAIGAFAGDGRMVGFSAVDPKPFGRNGGYVLLDQLYVSQEYRRKGIGRQLFRHTAAAAKRMMARKLYICAGSSEETIAFYHSLGCMDAVEVNARLAEVDPRDIALEYSV